MHAQGTSTREALKRTPLEPLRHDSSSKQYTPDEQNLYLAMLLEYGLVQAHLRNGSEFVDASPTQLEPLSMPEDLYHAYINKLASLLDSERGGKTVTSLVVQKGDSGVEYIFTSNARRSRELSDAENFLSVLLHILKDDKRRAFGPAASKNASTALKRRLLDHAVMFNIRRIMLYLKTLAGAISDCIEDLAKRQENTAPDLIDELHSLNDKTNFPQDIMAGSNEEHKFLKDCDTLLRALYQAKSSASLGRAITDFTNAENKRARPESFSKWSELRHYMSRLLNYRFAAETIVNAYNHWPELFDEFTVKSVPSSKPWPRPITDNGLSALDIIKTIMPPGDEHDACCESSRTMAIMGVDDHIRDQAGKKAWRPIVHAEVNLHAYLLMHERAHETSYWNECKYIGSSKPTCRMCGHYFQVHEDDVEVRPSHGNLYLNWRLPVLEDPEVSTEDLQQQRSTLVDDVTEVVMKDLKHTLRDRVIKGKKHDTSTSTSMLPNLTHENGYNEESVEEELAFSDRGTDSSGRTCLDSSSEDSGGASLLRSGGFSEDDASSVSLDSQYWSASDEQEFCEKGDNSCTHLADELPEMR